MPVRCSAAGVHEWRPSPNFRPRESHEQVRCVVIHATWMAEDEAALKRLCDRAAEVSCHYYIARDGKVIQLVDEADVAWHAGKSSWGGLEGLNPFSIGIEVGNAGPFGQEHPDGPPVGVEGAVVNWAAAEPYAEAQYVALAALVADIKRRYAGVGDDAVLGHDEVSPGRKSDPGPHFDWRRLRG